MLQIPKAEAVPVTARAPAPPPEAPQGPRSPTSTQQRPDRRGLRAGDSFGAAPPDYSRLSAQPAPSQKIEAAFKDAGLESHGELVSTHPHSGVVITKAGASLDSWWSDLKMHNGNPPSGGANTGAGNDASGDVRRSGFWLSSRF